MISRCKNERLYPYRPSVSLDTAWPLRSSSLQSSWLHWIGYSGYGHWQAWSMLGQLIGLSRVRLQPRRESVNQYLLPRAITTTYLEREYTRHTHQIVALRAHIDNLGKDTRLGPIWTKHNHQLSKIVNRSFSDRIDAISQPRHAQVAQLFIKELQSKLMSEQRNILNDCQTNSPLLVFGQLNDRWKKSRRQTLNADHW